MPLAYSFTAVWFSLTSASASKCWDQIQKGRPVLFDPQPGSFLFCFDNCVIVALRLQLCFHMKGSFLRANSESDISIAFTCPNFNKIRFWHAGCASKTLSTSKVSLVIVFLKVLAVGKTMFKNYDCMITKESQEVYFSISGSVFCDCHRTGPQKAPFFSKHPSLNSNSTPGHWHTSLQHFSLL